MAAKANWEGISYGDLQQDESFINASPQARTEAIADFGDFHGLKEYQVKRLQLIQEADYEADHSDGVSKQVSSQNANLLRDFLTKTAELESREDATQEDFAALRSEYASGITSLNEESALRQDKETAGREAAFQFDRFSKLAGTNLAEFGGLVPPRQPSGGEGFEAFEGVAGGQQPLNPELAEAGSKLRETLSSLGADPLFRVEGDDTIRRNPAFERFLRDAKITKGDFDSPVERTSTGEWFVNPALAVSDPDQVKEALAQVPLKERSRLEGEFEAKREEFANKAVQDLDFGELTSLGLTDEEARRFVKGKQTEEDTPLAVKAVGDYIRTSQDRGAVNTFVRENLASVGEGVVDLALIPSTIGSAASGEESDILKRARALRESEARKAQLRPEVGGFTEFSKAVSREIGPAILTRGVGRGAGRLGQALKLSPEKASKLAGWAATGFGGVRSGSGNVQELLEQGATGEEVLAAGIEGFATTFIISNIFNKFGAGGLEQFKAASPELKKAMAKSLKEKTKEFITVTGVGAAGEGFEEGLDNGINETFLNIARNWDKQKTPGQIWSESVFASGVGGFIGGGHAAAQATVKALATPAEQPTTEAGPALTAAEVETTVGQAEAAPEEEITSGVSNLQAQEEVDADIDLEKAAEAVETPEISETEDVPTYTQSTDELEERANKALESSADKTMTPPEAIAEEAPAPESEVDSDVIVAAEPVSSLVARTSPSERNEAFSNRRKAAERVAASLNKGDVVKDEEGVEWEIHTKPNSKGEAFLKDVETGEITGDPVNLPSSFTASTGRDSSGETIDIEAWTISRRAEDAPEAAPVEAEEETTAEAPAPEQPKVEDAPEAAPVEVAEKVAEKTPAEKTEGKVREDIPAKEDFDKLSRREQNRLLSPRVEHIQSAATKIAGGQNASSDAAVSAMTDALTAKPNITDAELNTIGRRAASKKGATRKAEVEARKAGDVATIDTGAAELLSDLGARPDEAAEQSDMLDKVKASLPKLSEGERKAMEGKLAGKDTKTIAEENGTTEKTVRTQLSRATEKLKDLVSEPQTKSGGKSDEQIVSEVKKTLAKDSDPRAQEAAKTLKVSNKTSPQIKAAKKIGKLLGRKVVVVNGLKQNGFFIPNNSDAIFISSKADRAETLVAFHELLHSFKDSNEKAYQQLKDAVKADLDAYAKEVGRPAPDREVLNEEFLADFMADRATTPEFWAKLDKKNPSLAKKLAEALRSLLRKIREGRIGTERFVEDLEAADAALVEALGSFDKTVTQEGGEARFEEARKEAVDEVNETLEKIIRPVQTAGQDNPTWLKRGVDYSEAEGSVSDITGFKWEDTPLTVKGAEKARQLLADLLNPKIVKQIQDALVAEGYEGERRFIALGLARASYFAYVTRLYAKNPALAAELFREGFILAKDLKVLFDTDGGVDASVIGATLRSFRNIEGGNVMQLLAAEMKGNEEFLDNKYQDAVKGRFKGRVSEALKSASDTELDTESASSEDVGSAEQAVEDALLETADKETLRKILAAEKRVDGLLRTLLKTMRGLTTESKFKAEESLATLLDNLESLLDGGADIDAKVEAAEKAVNAFEKNVSGPVAKRLRNQAKKARAEGKKATDGREAATGTTKTKNQVDILGKRTIGTANRAPKAIDSKLKALREKYNALLKEDLTKSEFVEKYVKLGGTEEVAAEVFEAKQKIEERKASAPPKTRKKVSGEKKAEMMFRTPSTKKKKKVKGRTVHQILMDEVVNNPRRKILNLDDRVALAEEILRERTDLSPSQIKAVARKVEGKLAKILEAKIKRNAKPIVKALQDGGALTPEQINKAIRLRVLEPSRGLTESFAALGGWQGLSGKEMAELASLEERISKVGQNTGTANRARFKQMRIIRKSTGVTPEAKRLLQSHLRGAMYSGTSSQLIGWAVGTPILVGTTMTEYAKVIADPRLSFSDKMLLMKEIHRSFMRGLQRGGREFLSVWKTGGQTSVEQLAGGQERQTEGRIRVDDLTVWSDQLTDRIAQLAKEIEEAPTAEARKKKAKKFGLYLKKVLAAQRATFIGLSSADAAVTQAIATVQASALAQKEARAAGMNAEEMETIRHDLMNNAQAFGDFLRNEAGMTDENEIAMEVQDRIEGAIFETFSKRIGDDRLIELRKQAIRNVQDMIGTGEVNDTWIGYWTEKLAGLVSDVPGGPLLFPAVLTVGNVTDFLMWTVPVVGAVRGVRSKYGKNAETFRGKFKNLDAEWQFAKRRNLAMVSHVVFSAMYAMLEINDQLDDDDKWFWYTGFYPTWSQAEKQRWKENGWDEHTLFLGGARLRLDRGFLQTLLYPAVMGKAALNTRKWATAEEGEEADLAAKRAFSDITGMVVLTVPGAASDRSNVDALQGDWASFYQFVSQKATSALPFSGALKSPRRISGPPLDLRQSDISFVRKMMNPIYANVNAEGAVVYRNAQFEKLDFRGNLWNAVRKFGVPVYFELDREGRTTVDREIMDVRMRHKVTTGAVKKFKEWKKVAEENGVEPTVQNYEKYGETWSKNFQDIYKDVSKEWPANPTDEQVKKAMSRIGSKAVEWTKEDLDYFPTDEVLDEKADEEAEQLFTF